MEKFGAPKAIAKKKKKNKMCGLERMVGFNLMTEKGFNFF